MLIVLHLSELHAILLRTEPIQGFSWELDVQRRNAVGCLKPGTGLSELVNGLGSKPYRNWDFRSWEHSLYHPTGLWLLVPRSLCAWSLMFLRNLMFPLDNIDLASVWLCPPVCWLCPLVWYFLLTLSHFSPENKVLYFLTNLLSISRDFM